MDWIDSFRKTGTLLFVSHSMNEVRRLCSRAIWIEDGLSPNTLAAYRRDLALYSDWLARTLRATGGQ